MAKVSENRGNQDDLSAEAAVTDFVRGLGKEHRMLVVLKSQLYSGRWDPMLDDLKNRLAGKPYIFKLNSRIKDDVDRIKELQAFESEQKVDLADYVDMP